MPRADWQRDACGSHLLLAWVSRLDKVGIGFLLLFVVGSFPRQIWKRWYWNRDLAASRKSRLKEFFFLLCCFAGLSSKVWLTLFFSAVRT